MNRLTRASDSNNFYIVDDSKVRHDVNGYFGDAISKLAMIKRVGITVVMSVILLFTGCSANTTSNRAGIDIDNISTSIGAVEKNTNNFDTQSFKYTITLANNEAADITIVSVRPVLSEKFLERVSNKDTAIQVNKTISQGSSMDVTGEIIFDAKGLTKEQIVGLEPFIKEVKILEEREIKKSF